MPNVAVILDVVHNAFVTQKVFSVQRLVSACWFLHILLVYGWCDLHFNILYRDYLVNILFNKAMVWFFCSNHDVINLWFYR